MNAEEMKKCPFCAEMIRAEAVKCRFCGSMLSKGFGNGLASPQGFWHRVSEGKKIAGVCTGIARQLDAPVLIMPLRVFFAVSILFYFFGPILYVLLWMLMPAPEDEQAQGHTAYQQPAGGHSPGAQPPVVNNYPGQHAAPQAPPMAGSPAASPEQGEADGDGTIKMDDEPPHKQPHSAD